MNRLILATILCGLSADGKWESRWMDVEATAYCPCSICTDGDGKTSTGRDAHKDGVAVDPAVIPLGSRIDVPGITLGINGNGSWLLADDTGGKIKGTKIDIRFQDHATAKKHGKKKLRVRVWTKKENGK